jgi:hypothetical protein
VTGDLIPRGVLMWLVSSVLVDADGRGLVHSVQLGQARQGVLGPDDAVGDEPRVLIDFNRGRPLLTAGGVPIGDRVKDVVILWDQKYRIRRPWWRSQLHADVTCGERTVLTIRETTRPRATVHRYDLQVAPDLDSIVTLTLTILLARPDKMGVLGELLDS